MFWKKKVSLPLKNFFRYLFNSKNIYEIESIRIVHEIEILSVLLRQFSQNRSLVENMLKKRLYNCLVYFKGFFSMHVH